MNHQDSRSVKPAGKTFSPTALALVLGLALAFPGSAALATNNPIPGVDIIVKKDPGGIPVSAPTNNDGAYKITGLAPGKYDLSIAGQRVQTITVGANRSVSGILSRQPDGSASITFNGQTGVVLVGLPGINNPIPGVDIVVKPGGGKVAENESPHPLNRETAPTPNNGDVKAAMVRNPEPFNDPKSNSAKTATGRRSYPNADGSFNDPKSNTAKAATGYKEVAPTKHTKHSEYEEVSPGTARARAPSVGPAAKGVAIAPMDFEKFALKGARDSAPQKGATQGSAKGVAQGSTKGTGGEEQGSARVVTQGSAKVAGVEKQGSTKGAGGEEEGSARVATQGSAKGAAKQGSTKVTGGEKFRIEGHVGHDSPAAVKSGSGEPQGSTKGIAQGSAKGVAQGSAKGVAQGSAKGSVVTDGDIETGVATPQSGGGETALGGPDTASRIPPISSEGKPTSAAGFAPLRPAEFKNVAPGGGTALERLDLGDVVIEAGAKGTPNQQLNGGQATRSRMSANEASANGALKNASTLPGGDEEVPGLAGQPIPGVDVKLGKNPGGSIVATSNTDSHGNFHFNNLPAGNYKLTLPGLPPQLLTVGVDGIVGGTVMRGPDGHMNIFDRWGNLFTAPTPKTGNAKSDNDDRKNSDSPVAGFGTGMNAGPMSPGGPMGPSAGPMSPGAGPMGPGAGPMGPGAGPMGPGGPMGGGAYRP